MQTHPPACTCRQRCNTPRGSRPIHTMSDTTLSKIARRYAEARHCTRERMILALLNRGGRDAVAAVAKRLHLVRGGAL